jgi:hypothetical protein
VPPLFILYIEDKRRGKSMFKVNDYVRYQGRVCIVSYVDEYGLYLEDVDNDESLFVTADDFNKMVLF